MHGQCATKSRREAAFDWVGFVRKTRLSEKSREESHPSANQNQARVLVLCCRRTTHAEGRGEEGAADLNRR